MTILSPTIAHLAPVQTVCNYATLWFRNVASLLSVGDANGTTQRFIIIATPQGPNNEGGPSSAPANGGVPGQKDNYLHSNPYPNTASPGQPKECEAGNEPFIVGKQEIGNAPGTQPAKTETTKPQQVMLGRRHRSDDERVPRKDRMGANPVVVGVVVLVVVCIGVFFGFAKHVPFTHGFRVKAVFESSNSIRKNSPVRIAGVNVGKVVKVEGKPGTDAAVVTMDVTRKGLPIHKDATFKIRPRIFLEGNFFVDVTPGTPSAPTIDDGDTIPITQTATPVQLDQVLSALQSDTRTSLQKTLDGLGTGLNYKPSKAQDTDADPSARGESAGQSLNDAIRYGERSLKGTAIVADAFLGVQRHDLSRLIDGLSRTTEGLGRNDVELRDLVTNFNTTVAATASQAANLSASIRLLGPTLQNADRALDSLNASFPNTRAFAREILPGVNETAATIDAAFPWITQARGLLGPSELQGVAEQLSPATSDLAKVIDESLVLLPQADLVAKCTTNVVLPTGDVKIDDGALSSGAENYKEFWYTMVGLAGEGQNFDGNGMYVRFQPGGGDQTVSLGPSGGLTDKLFANAVLKPLGTRPAFPGKRPPYKPDVPCYKNALPNLNAAPTGPPDGGGAAARASPAAGGARAMRTAIRKHARDFAFVLGLVLVSALVGGYILSNQRFYLPHWVPVVGSDFVDYKAQFSTAQSVTPGQGQTVQIAGVDVGDITKVDLVDGRAVVTMKIRRKYTPIYKNATALLRPKTGLNDMVIELDPGSQTAGTAPAGFTVPIDQTLPNVNFDEILSSLDTDTRTYLQLLVGAAGEGLDGQGKALSADAQALRADRPLPGQAQRRAGRARPQHPPRDPQLQPALAGAWGPRTTTWRRWSIPPTGSSRRSPTRTPTCAPALQELPGALDATNTTLAKVTKLGNVLGPTLGALRPGARALGPSLVQTRPFLAETTPIIKNQLRPFARAALPVVTVLRPAARDLALVTPEADHLGARCSTTCSTSWPTTRRARRRATCSGPRGPTTTAPPSSPPRTRMARSATASSWPRARPCRCSTSSAGPCRSSARSARCSTRPTRTPCARRPARPGRRPAQPGTTTPTVPRRRCPCAARGGPADAEAGSQPRPHPRHGGLRALVLRPAALPVAGLRRPDPAAAQGLSLQHRLPRGRHALPGGRRADLRRVGGQGQGDQRPTRRPAPRTRRSSSIPPTRRSPRTRRRSCARRRCWARPTSS